MTCYLKYAISFAAGVGFTVFALIGPLGRNRVWSE